MASLNAESFVNARHIESAQYTGADDTRFLQPAAGRIIAGAGLAGGQLQQVLRHHGLVARRIVLGRQILKIIGKRNKPL